jgi:uncharacterized protein (UPF0335 family)
LAVLAVFVPINRCKFEVKKVGKMTQLEFQNQQQNLIDELEKVALEIKKIDKKSGETILSYLGTITLNAIGVPLVIPKQFGYAVLGIVGIPFLLIKQRKLRPLIAKVERLETEFSNNADLYAQQTKNQDKQDNIDYSGKLALRSANLSKNHKANIEKNDILAGFAILGIGAIVYLKRKNK